MNDTQMCPPAPRCSEKIDFIGTDERGLRAQAHPAENHSRFRGGHRDWPKLLSRSFALPDWFSFVIIVSFVVQPAFQYD